MLRLIRQAEREVIRRRVTDVNAITSEVYASLVDSGRKFSRLDAGALHYYFNVRRFVAE